VIAALKTQAQAWRAEGRPAVVVDVVQARGSVPRGTGTHMVVAAHAVLGTIGGGHLELKAIDAARLHLQAHSRDTAPHELHFALGPSLGQCCGGAVRLRLQDLSACDPAQWPDDRPRFRLQLYGAGHVGRAIVRLLDELPCQVQWIDERDAEFPAAPSAPHIERLCVEPVQAEVAQARAGDFFLVLTHSHELDLAITEAILRRGDFGFLGLIGSATKRARFAHRFEDRGLPAEVIARMTCPIGLPGISGKEPDVIALAVVAQLMQRAESGPSPESPERLDRDAAAEPAIAARSA
jgi:xanthine dehydrogenase accessory factor